MTVYNVYYIIIYYTFLKRTYIDSVFPINPNPPKMSINMPINKCLEYSGALKIELINMMYLYLPITFENVWNKSPSLTIAMYCLGS